MTDQQQAMERIRAGDWHGAHELVQPHSDPLSCRIHGYLHRDEGDLGNAGHWYARAGMELPDNTLEDERIRLEELAGL